MRYTIRFGSFISGIHKKSREVQNKIKMENDMVSMLTFVVL